MTGSGKTDLKGTSFDFEFYMLSDSLGLGDASKV